jgi:hypothetical protein
VLAASTPQPPQTAVGGLDSLLAVALVKCTWFAAAVPMLLRRPTKLPLHTEAKTTPARCVWYASFIRKVGVSWLSPLWRALIEAGWCLWRSIALAGAAAGGVARDSIGKGMPMNRTYSSRVISYATSCRCCSL